MQPSSRHDADLFYSHECVIHLITGGRSGNSCLRRYDTCMPRGDGGQQRLQVRRRQARNLIERNLAVEMYPAW